MNPIYPFRTVYGISSARLHFFKSFLIIYNQVFFGFHLFLLMVVQTLLLLPFQSPMYVETIQHFSLILSSLGATPRLPLFIFSPIFSCLPHIHLSILSRQHLTYQNVVFSLPKAQTVKHGWSYSCFIKFSIEPNRYFDNINA